MRGTPALAAAEVRVAAAHLQGQWLSAEIV